MLHRPTVPPSKIDHYKFILFKPFCETTTTRKKKKQQQPTVYLQYILISVEKQKIA